MRKLLFTMFIAIMVSNAAFAGMGAFDVGTINQQNVRDMRLHEVQTRAQNRSAIIQKEKTEQEEQNKVSVPAITKTIKTIRFSGNEKIPAGDLYRVVSGYIGAPATEQTIIAIRKLVTKYYQANGFYSAIVIPETNGLTSGSLVFDIQEGDKNSITIN